MARARRRAGAAEVEGPLAPVAADYRSRLQGSGYSTSTIAKLLWQAGNLSQWMQSSAFDATDLTTERIHEFLAERRAARGRAPAPCRGWRRCSRSSPSAGS